MNANIRLGRIAGFPLAMNWSVLVVIGLLTWSLAVGVLPETAPDHSTTAYWLMGLGAAVVFFGSLLAHELAHAVVARRYGVEVKGLTLWIFGGVANLGGEPTTPQADLRIAVVGPATSVALSVLFGIVAGFLDALAAPELLVAAVVWLAAINLVLGVFNLLPGAPLDGGRVLRALLWRRHGDQARAALSAARAGQAVGYGLIWLGLVELLMLPGVGGLWLAFIGWFVLSASRAEMGDVIARKLLSGVLVDDVMSRRPQVAPGEITIADLIESYLFGHPHSAYPVEGPDHRILGLVTLRQMRALPASERAITRVADVAIPLDHVPTAGPDEPLVTALEHGDHETGGRILVFDRGRLVGIVTPTDVTRAIDVRTLSQAA